MFISEAIKNMGMASAGYCASADENGYRNINIMFINNEEMEDETQFDVCSYVTENEFFAELECLWKDFCQECGFREDAITEIWE